MCLAKQKSPYKSVQILKKGRLGSTLYIPFVDHLYSRTSARCDQPARPRQGSHWHFYSRTSARCDASIGAERVQYHDFYSRTLAGCDQFQKGLCLFFFISTHAPLRGATKKDFSGVMKLKDFYSRTLAGCDPVFLTKLATVSNFYSRTLAGCDYLSAEFNEGVVDFYSRTLAGCDSD